MYICINITDFANKSQSHADTSRTRRQQPKSLQPAEIGSKRTEHNIVATVPQQEHCVLRSILFGYPSVVPVNDVDQAV